MMPAGKVGGQRQHSYAEAAISAAPFKTINSLEKWCVTWISQTRNKLHVLIEMPSVVLLVRLECTPQLQRDINK
jgi:hypothetical protein